MKKLIVLFMLLTTPLLAVDYKLQQGGVREIESGAFIPNCAGNTDWQEYQKWLSKGNTPKPEFSQAELDAKAVQAQKQADKAQAVTDLKKVNVDELKDIEEVKAVLKLILKQMDM
jgi:hypothetical protein